MGWDTYKRIVLARWGRGLWGVGPFLVKMTSFLKLKIVDAQNKNCAKMAKMVLFPFWAKKVSSSTLLRGHLAGVFSLNCVLIKLHPQNDSELIHVW